ncbi:uncharacterized protein BO96DRAFT_437063 [Aspergillus niger CBS 101883]|uniref:Uncharacterized protein n=2 Tax=Aspergillus niger TaxID=5061 RepID=A2QP95_ASPNC|nr:uncharacterized protein BO96DRAFT_437063 [Aspergillus niger CBS 101883]XP_059601062.1 hypothetical protein An07g08660 [Aspergillus niger]PYH53431.1 hypothetical protein BO96DRAFT_437063 [Aspergillus niger CBS 101883]CAK39660.1 hypothetical protein An07g08660 [Aspergillus niger]
MGLYFGSPEASSMANAWEWIGDDGLTSSVTYVNSAFVVAGGWAKECVGILDKESRELRDGKLMRCSGDRFHG